MPPGNPLTLAQTLAEVGDSVGARAALGRLRAVDPQSVVGPLALARLERTWSGCGGN